MKGHLIFAQNSDVDYVKQAYALALTIKKKNCIKNVALVTNNKVAKKYNHAFDYIIDIPWNDDASQSHWKIENRWKLIHVSPFNETMAYDSDMLLLSSNDHWWSILEKHDVFLTSEVLNYRNNVIKDYKLRKVFIENNLPNVYFGFNYFRKTRRAYEFYKWLELIVKNYNIFKEKFTPNFSQNFCSMDVSAALATKMLDAVEEFTLPNSIIKFVHMKKELQDWQEIPASWSSCLSINFTKNLELYLSNNLQNGLFHYTEDEFLTNEIIGLIEQ